MANNGYDFYMDKCLLPIPPDKLQIKVNNTNKTVTLINEGEVNILKRAGLTEIEFGCMIPQVRYPFAVYKSGFRDAGYFLDYFEALKNGKKPFRFIVCRRFPDGGRLFNTNIKVSLEDYKITEDAKEGFDLNFQVKLKQWRDYGAREVRLFSGSMGTQAGVEPSREEETSPSPSETRTYTVVKGDCLWTIAKRFYGDGSKYSVIYNANKDVVGGSPNRIYPGQILVIPAKQGGASGGI